MLIGARSWCVTGRATSVARSAWTSGVGSCCGRGCQRQLGHANLGITSVYLQGIDNAEIIDTVHARRAPMIPASAGLRHP